jgi:hypothetical protein
VSEGGPQWKDGPHWQLPWKRYPIRAASLQVDMDLLEVFADDPIDEPPQLAASRTMWGSTGAALGGGAILTDALLELQQAESYFSTGSLFGLVAGTLIVAGAALSLYARWDDARRPLPWKAA